MGNHCLGCAEPLPEGNCWCGKCLGCSQQSIRLYIPYQYAFPINELILQLKFAAKLDYARDLAELLIPFLEAKYQNDHYPELLVPIPLSNRRMAARGYNQAGEITRWIAKKLQIAVNLDDLVRVRETTPQSTLDHQRRTTNLRGAFALRDGNFSGKHLALIDDVITTGNTVREAAKVLLKAGVTRIDVWCCAKTILNIN